MPLVIYSVLRLALFGVALLALAAAHMGGWLLVVVAAFVAWALSYVLLAGPRDAAALWLAERSVRRKASGVRFSAGVESDAVAEDAEALATTGAPGSAATSDRADTAATDSRAEDPGSGPVVGGDAQSASPRPSSTP